MRINVRSNLEYEVEDSPDGQVFVLTGAINENCIEKLDEICDVAGDACSLHLKGISYINSIGIKNWIGFLDKLTKNRKIKFIKTSTPIIRQLNMIPEIAKNSEILDFYGDFLCEDCGFEKSILFDVTEGYDALVSRSEGLKCEQCESELEMEESPEEFFCFLQHLDD